MSQDDMAKIAKTMDEYLNGKEGGYSSGDDVTFPWEDTMTKGTYTNRNSVASLSLLKFGKLGN